MIRVSIPSYRKVKDDSEEIFTVYLIEVYVNGRIHNIEKRYSEFEDIHKQVKKVIRTPEFPPKRMLRFSLKVLEHRRLALQTYLQGVLDSGLLPKSLLHFLGVNLPRLGSFDSLDKMVNEAAITHQTMIAFPSDAFLSNNSTSSLADIIQEGVKMGLYAPREYVFR